MAGAYSQIFTLTDIFNNKKLKDKIPLINYKEKEKENGKISRTTNVKSVNRQVFDKATSAARPFYKPIKTTRSGDTIIIGGELVGNHDGAVDAVYNALQGIKSLLVWTANNSEIIKSALKEAEKAKRNRGIDCKLYLRAQSMQQIEGMSKREIQALMNNIMENIVYGDNFPETQKKFKVEELPTKSRMTYDQRKIRWRFMVGAE
jgi:hypothetical protein